MSVRMLVGGGVCSTQKHRNTAPQHTDLVKAITLKGMLWSGYGSSSKKPSV